MKYIGINIGALTIKLAALDGDQCFSIVVPHQGRPLAVLENILDQNNFAGAAYFSVYRAVSAISRKLQPLNAPCAN